MTCMYEVLGVVLKDKMKSWKQLLKYNKTSKKYYFPSRKTTLTP